MLEIIPLKDKILQESVCIHCGVTFDASLMAYAAYESGKPIGICQFSIKDDEGYLIDLKSCDNAYPSRPIFLMGSAVLNFIDMCGAHNVKCENKNIDASLLCSIGFSKKSNGSFEIDLSDAVD